MPQFIVTTINQPLSRTYTAPQSIGFIGPRFQASAENWLKTALDWVITQRVVVTA
jgi:hypothetical protein